MTGKRPLIRRVAKGLMATVVMLSTTVVSAEPDTLRLWHRNYESPSVRAIVQLALDKTPEYGEVTLKPSPPMPQGRALRQLTAGQHHTITIANVATSTQREEQLLPIAIPFDRGLLGFRVCLIRKSEQERFSDIRSAQDFRARGLLIGQGSHWPDRFVLQANGFDVVNTPQFNNLFPMLERGRFDCFMRGAGEVLIDLEQYGSEAIKVEEELLFVYEMPSYLFVAPNNNALAQRLELGLRRAVEDSSFDAYFDQYFQTAIDTLNLNERRVIQLDNPFLDYERDHIKAPILPFNPDRLRPLPADSR